MKYLLFVLTLLISCNIPTGVDLFIKAPESSLLPLERTAGLSDYNRLLINDDVLKAVKLSNKSIDFSIPYNDEVFYIHLDRIDIFAPDFNVISDSEYIPATFTKGVYYSGYVKGRDSSVVTLSITNNNQVNGIISIPGMDDLTLTRALEQPTNQYIILNSFQESKPITFNCMTADTATEYKQTARTGSEAVSSGCVTVDFELDYSTYQHFQSVSAATSWISSLFAPVVVLYKNEGIDISIKSVYVWTAPDGYSQDAGTALTQLTTKRQNDPNFKGTFVQLIRGKSGGSLSGIAYVGTLCVPGYRFSYAEPMYTYSAYPAYSWSVNVITHELGHSMGSPHTQSCTWPGGAIDNCYQTEGGCPPGPAPVNGGTIMSYCHMTSYGMKFSNGFGPLPGNKIREYYNKSNCISCAILPPPVDPPASGKINLALNKPASQSSQYGSYQASYAVDGDVNTFSHTGQEVSPWISVDLQETSSIDSIEIVNRAGCCGYRLREFKLFVADAPVKDFNQPFVAHYINNSGLGNGGIFRAGGLNTSGRFLTLMAKNFQAGDYLHLAEIKIYGGGGTGPICKDTIYKVPSVRDSAGKVCR